MHRKFLGSRCRQTVLKRRVGPTTQERSIFYQLAFVYTLGCYSSMNTSVRKTAGKIHELHTRPGQFTEHNPVPVRLNAVHRHNL